MFLRIFFGERFPPSWIVDRRVEHFDLFDKRWFEFCENVFVLITVRICPHDVCETHNVEFFPHFFALGKFLQRLFSCKGTSVLSIIEQLVQFFVAKISDNHTKVNCGTFFTFFDFFGFWLPSFGTIFVC